MLGLGDEFAIDLGGGGTVDEAEVAEQVRERGAVGGLVGLAVEADAHVEG